MTAFQTIMLSWHGEPEIPSGASVASRLKSRMRRRLAAVDWGQRGSEWDDEGVLRAQK